jgi:hypothetical protein
MREEYTGRLSAKYNDGASDLAVRAYVVWCGQKKRAKWKYKILNGREYSAREFIPWWITEFEKKEWVWPTVGRIDHSKGYSFDNIRMEEMSDNVKERNTRLGNPGRTHRKILCVTPTYQIECDSKRSAALWFGISEKTVYNHCQGRTKQAWKYGPRKEKERVIFSWLNY